MHDGQCFQTFYLIYCCLNDCGFVVVVLSEMSFAISKLLTELFRVKIFYGRSLLPDVSGASKEFTGQLLDCTTGLATRLATEYAAEYRQWREATSSLSALSTLLRIRTEVKQQQQQQQQQQHRSSAKNADVHAEEEEEEEESSLEFVSSVIDSFHHDQLVATLS
jgi:hypothetical protein